MIITVRVPVTLTITLPDSMTTAQAERLRADLAESGFAFAPAPVGALSVTLAEKGTDRGTESPGFVHPAEVAHRVA